MDFDELRILAGKAVNKITAKNPDISQWHPSPLLEDAPSISLAAIAERLDIPTPVGDRLLLFEKLLVLELYLSQNQNVGSDPSDRETVLSLLKWTANTILPSELFAERSPYATVQKPPLTPDLIAKEHVLSSTGLNILSHLIDLAPQTQSSSSTALSTCLASFTDPTTAWTTPSIHRKACDLIESHLDQSKLPQILHSILQDRVKPLFAKTTNPAITSQGRKAIAPLPANPASLHSDLDESTKPWKYKDVYIVTVFQWVISQLDESSIPILWPLLIPPLLTLIDDTTTRFKTLGCTLLTTFLNKCPPPLLHRTGLASVFENAVSPCLSYLPSLTPETESVKILGAAYPALITLANARFASDQGEGQGNGRRKGLGDGREGKKGDGRIKALDRILRSGILKGHGLAGEHVEIAEVLVSQLGVLVAEMGLESVRHLKHILPLLSNTLAAPFATAYPPLLIVSLKTLETVIRECRPRVAYHRGEILRGLCVCWCRIKEEGSEKEGLGDVRGSLREVVQILTGALGEDGSVDVWEEYQMLIDSDGRLGDLLVI